MKTILLLLREIWYCCEVRYENNTVAVAIEFSASDLTEDEDQQPVPIQPQNNPRPPPQAVSQQGGQTSRPSSAGPPEMSLSFKPSGVKTPSAPTSPLKSKENFLQRVSSLASNVTSNLRGEIQNVTQQVQPKPAYNKDRCFTLLVVDDQATDWSRYFRGRKIHVDWDIRVEQAEFKEISVSANPEGAFVSLAVIRNGSRVVRSFKPDFVLIRQNIRDADQDHRSVLFGLMYGNIPSINSLESVYGFLEKPWVFSQLLKLQKQLGKEAFPLIDQCYYPNFKEMVAPPRLPAVLKLGHAHGGLGKFKVESPADYQDAASVVAVAGTYCTVEPYLESRADLHVQKIGQSYKAFVRRSISGHWKTNVGSAMLEQVAMTERYKSWLDAAADALGNLDLCEMEVLLGRDGKESIIEINDCAFTLLGESQEEDRRLIAELVLLKMQNLCTPPGMVRVTSKPSMSLVSSNLPSPTESDKQSVKSFASSATENVPTQASQNQQQTPAQPNQQPVASSTVVPNGLQATDSRENSPLPPQQVTQPPPVPPRDALAGPTRRAEDGTGKVFGRQGSQASLNQLEQDDGEDTMKNLRKTFAGLLD
ncbi:synapsin-like isoform X2 [Artemia franciscana]|uniref:synapsin-like isoform X2 n=1 Tax=Artemia franciscana TaxID=6661 RepID=UPI0032DAE87E